MKKALTDLKTRTATTPKEGSDLLTTGERWLYALKLLTFLLVIGSVYVFLGAPRLLQTPSLIYAILTLYIPISAIWKKLTLPGPLHRVTLMMQLIFELTVEIGILYFSGAALSPYMGLIYLTIISGALTYRLVGALTLASIASMGYLYVSWIADPLARSITPGLSILEIITNSPDELFFSGFLQTLSFYLSAFVAGFFSERRQRQDKQLADTSRALSKAKLQTDEIIQQLTTGLLTIDDQGKISLFNKSAEELLGIESSHARGRDFRAVLSGPVAELGQELALAFESGVNRPRREVTITRPDGTLAPLGVSIATINDSAETASGIETLGSDTRLGVIAIFQDITEAKEIQARARESERLMAVAELSAAMAHEIRNPLAAIAGSVQVLGNELSLENEEARLFDLILKETARLNRMLGDFLSYARTDRTKFKKVELCHIVIDTIEMLKQHPAYRSDISLNYESDDAVVYVIGDDDSIKQILHNLLLNAFEALSAHESSNKSIKVMIERLKSGSEAHLVVSDNGPGISPDIVGKIFTPFYSTKQAGSGLGLAIVHRLTELMEVGLDLDSEEGRGTEFCLRFSCFESETSAGLPAPQSFISEVPHPLQETCQRPSSPDYRG